uniref:Uncharacterized protein n=1 Tax=Chlamydomonas chlamydogama TaxID=225041 RepID=A0A6T5TMH5_9CHLO|mmetsp:Transcript_1531/g.3454  ORF Transcript_1531/g.3454 Transcript_1531/m.3454 type:complete len:148 (+) Transcript_1531:157-600(+)|eukprot:CAMPEP_0202895728 /NCGR_PEP_ID=MMETSP1392-20130828/4874_1 /ASSEMBLY_ACC=CAM_ASM_000868 /TAXON_ID=225041 /ORGANISM="Chlamydomonas chlamydogama, Strain SAG 11-48b" /LENGTH=147 /DNA_ID=CAMNT_0049580849 /DNA_START=157 /DNA_END=600 /DNA_ORIENTATION=-
MSGQSYSVEFTTGVIEKLAGVKKQEKSKPKSAVTMPIAPRGLITPEAVSLSQTDAHLAKALHSSTRVGSFLLKHEEEETKKIHGLAQELLDKYKFPQRPVPCQKERQDAVSCYEANTKDPLKCAAAVDAFSKCSHTAFEAYVKRVKA